MAGIAGLARGDMAGRLLQSVLRKVRAAVTGGTCLRFDRGLCVIHGCRGPVDIATLVAGVALFGHLDVRCRHGQRVLAGIGRVVTGRTNTNRQHMAHLGRLESTEILVAVGALLGARGNMSGRQALGRCPVMAGRAFAVGRRIMSVGNGCPA